MTMLAIILCSMFLGDTPYFLYLKDGRLLEVRDMPRFEGKFCYFVLKDGEKSMLPSELIDLQKTEGYNLEIREQAEAAEAAASELAAAQAKAGKEPPKIRLSDSRDLEGYQPKLPPNTGDVYQTGTGEATDVLGEPRVREWSSEDDIYLAKETISRIQQGYRIDCLLRVNSVTGVINAKLKLSLNLDNGQTMTLERDATPSSIPFEGTARVQFQVDTPYLISGTSYSVSAELE